MSYSPCFHPTQATPQETHTREISWLLFIHEKTQKPTSKPYEHPPVRCGPLSLAVLFLPGWLGLGTAALCAGSGVAGSRRPESPGLRYGTLQSGHSKEEALGQRRDPLYRTVCWQVQVSASRRVGWCGKVLVSG